MRLSCCSGPRVQTKCGEVRGSKMRSRYKRETIYAFRHIYVLHCKLNLAHEILFSVADPGCLSIPDTKKEKGKNIIVLPFFVATNITKLKLILSLNWKRKIFWPILQIIIELFTSKIVTKTWFGIRDPEKTYSNPGSRGLEGTGSESNLDLFRISAFKMVSDL
jgi:hypothetical protein